MICPHCQTNNPGGAKFCMNCGKPIAVACQNCGHENSPQAQFCINCGRQLILHSSLAMDPIQRLIPEEFVVKLETARKSQAMQGERRVVTILFCDVQGSTSMAKNLDPEEWAEIMNQAFDYLITPIYKYEGTLARLMGDAILAFFGAPIAHEDDPRRAILAGLDIVNGIQNFQEKIKRQYHLDFNVRVGINTGLVVVGGVGSDLFMEYTALGDAINIASRMEQTAQPGTIQIAKDTYELVTPLFDFEMVEGIEVKGVEKPVPVYRVLGEKDRPGSVRGIEGLDTPLIGRLGELGKIKQSLDDLLNGKGQIINLIGEAGLGKSRLIREIRSIWETDDLGMEKFGTLASRWNQVSGVSYETTYPYGVIQRLIRNFIGVNEADQPDHIRRKFIETFAAPHIELPPETINVFETLLGIREKSNGNYLEGEELKRAIYKELTTTLELLVGEKPTVLVIDDLHWADPASVEFIIHLFQLADKVPILFICALRPERYSPAWMVKQAAESDYSHRYLEIELSPLSEDDSGELVDRLLTVSDLPEDLRSLILKKSDGNPFFVEEVIRTLIDNGVVVRNTANNKWHATKSVEDISIPSNLQALLNARIDRLEDTTKHILQLASVIGRSFYYQVLDIINDTTDGLDVELNNLLRLELILENAREPYLEYVFRHALTQETAYNTILLKHRREFHRRVGEALLQLYPERIDDFSTVLGHHFYMAQDLRALAYFRKEGDAALRLYANQEATSYYTQAIEVALWNEKPEIESLIHLYTQRGRAYELDSRFEEAIQNYEEMENLGKTLNSQRLILEGLVLQALIYSIASNLFNQEQGEKLVQRAMVLAEELKDKKAQAKLYWILGNLYRFSEEAEKALSAGDTSVELAREIGDEELLAYALNDNSHNYSMRGSILRGFEYLQEASKLWRKLNNKAMLADSLSGLAAASMYMGKFEDAYHYSGEAYQISQAIDNIWGKAYSKFAVGIIHWDQGDIEKALETVHQCLDDSIQASFYAGQTISRVNLFLIYYSLGMHEKAVESLTITDYDPANSLSLSEAFFGSFRVLAHVAAGDFDVAKEMLDERLAIADKLISWNRYYDEYAKSHLYIAKGDYVLAVEKISKLVIYLEDKGFVFLNHELMYLLGYAYLNLEKDELARESFEDAFTKADRQGSRRMMWRILLELSRLDVKEGNKELALNRRIKAREYLDYIIEHIPTQEYKEAFLAQPDVQEVIEREIILGE
jgi:predicted ATPase/class 3 adenylate cyclase